MLNVHVHNKTKDKQLEKLFQKKLKLNMDLNHDTLESLVVTTIKNTLHHWKFEQEIPGYKKIKKNDTYVSCVFCMKEFNECQYKRTLHCGHSFHKKCIDNWVFNLHNEDCPQCKTKILKN